MKNSKIPTKNIENSASATDIPSAITDKKSKNNKRSKQKIVVWTPKLLATRTGVTVATLHFYEDKGLIFSTRTLGNQRRYHRSMVRRIAFIQAGKNAGITLAEIKEVLDKLPKSRTPSRADWEVISSHWREILNTRITQLESMRDKFTRCISCGCLSLESCAIYNPNDENAYVYNDLNTSSQLTPVN